MRRLYPWIVAAAVGTTLFNNCVKSFETIDMESRLSSGLGSPQNCAAKSNSSKLLTVDSPFKNSKVLIRPSNKNGLQSKISGNLFVPMDEPLLVIIGQPCLSNQTEEELADILSSDIEIDLRNRNPELKFQAFPIRPKKSLSIETIEAISQRNSCVVGLTNNSQVQIEQSSEEPMMEERRSAFNQAIQLEKIKILNSKNKTGQPVRVAVIDTGVDINHPDLRNMIDGQVLHNVTTEPAFDLSGHGTHVAGLISQTVNFDPSIAKIIPIKALSTFGSGMHSDVFNAVQVAISLKADVISMSLGSEDPQSLAIDQSMINSTLAANIVLVVSAGNKNKEVVTPNEQGLHVYPASLSGVDGVISVGSLDLETGLKSIFSNYGALVDIATIGCHRSYTNPENDIGLVSTFLGSKYKGMCGTSMSTPVMSGMVALMVQTYRTHRSSLSPAEIEQELKASTDGRTAPELPRALDINKYISKLLSVQLSGNEAKSENPCSK